MKRYECKNGNSDYFIVEREDGVKYPVCKTSQIEIAASVIMAIVAIGVIALGPTSDDTQKSHVDHSISPRQNLSGKGVHMGQFSVKICQPIGSVLNGNQHFAHRERCTGRSPF
jgi:hypothetical protein